MKTKLLLFAIMLLGLIAPTRAQYCGMSGTGVCTPTSSALLLSQFDSESIPCAVRNTNNSVSMNFTIDSMMLFSGVNIIVSSVRIDSIIGLPSGMCWSSNKADNTFNRGEEGCIRFSGPTTALAGQYRLGVLVTFSTNIGIIGPNFDTDLMDLKFYLRLKNSNASTCPPIDTNQTSPYDPGVNADSLSYISGYVFNDANQNGQRDNGEAGLRNIRVNISDDYALSNNSGFYSAYVLPGTYTISGVGLESGAISFPSGSYTVNAIQGQQQNGNNVATIISPNYCEAEASVVNSGMPPRPGFSNVAKVSLTNLLSQTPLSITLRLSYDDAKQNYISNTQTLAGQGTGYIEWNISNLPLGSTWNAEVTLQTEVTGTLGTTTNYTVTSSNPSCPGLVVSADEQVLIVGSYDPNDKAVSPIGFSDHHGINPNQVQTLTYKVRFQNTGTFLAEKVVIVDTISPNLDLTTLRVLSASHNYEVNIGDDRAVKFIFNQIMLPDSNSDEPGSHGYVQFTIDLNESLAQNTQILNKADIYFDFNDPIRTNTAYNTVDYTVVGIKEAANNYSLSLYPNPANGSVQIGVDERLLGEQLTLSDMSGRIVLSTKVEKPLLQIDLASYANGVYLVRTGNVVKKLVKE